MFSDSDWINGIQLSKDLSNADLIHKIRIQWFEELGIEDMDNIRFLNHALEYLRKNGILERYKEYRFIFSKNDRRLFQSKNIKVILDLGYIKRRTMNLYRYHVFFVKDVIHETIGYREA